MEYIGRIIELIQKLFVWWFIVEPWEQGIRVRGGKKVKLLGPGMHFRIPFYDHIYSQTTRLRIVALAPQTVSTKDGKTLSIVSSVGYSISDCFKVHQTLFQPEGTICNIVMGAVSDFVCRNIFEDCLPSQIEESVTKLLTATEFGLKFEYMKITGFANVRTYRLIQDGHWTPDNGSTFSTSNHK